MEFRLNLVCPKEAVWEIELGHGNIISRKISVMGLVEEYLTGTMQQHTPTNHTCHRT